MAQKNVNILNKYNKNLSTIIETPEEETKDFLIISHCFTCSKLYKLYNSISRKLVQNGYGVVRYDAMGLGQSEGDFSESTFTTNVEDLISVYDYIAQNHKVPKYLLGHSLGGLVSIKAANVLGSVLGVATVGSPFNFDNLINLFSIYEKELRVRDNILVNLAGREISLGLSYLEDLKNEDVNKIIKDFNKSIIIFHSNSDGTVPYKDGLKLFNSIGSNKNFITLKDVDHLVSEKKDSTYIGNILYKWMESH